MTINQMFANSVLTTNKEKEYIVCTFLKSRYNEYGPFSKEMANECFDDFNSLNDYECAIVDTDTGEVVRES